MGLFRFASAVSSRASLYCVSEWNEYAVTSAAALAVSMIIPRRFAFQTALRSLIYFMMWSFVSGCHYRASLLCEENHKPCGAYSF